MEFYFNNYFLDGNEIIFYSFFVCIVAIIVFSIYAVGKEIRKNGH